jgi:TRAP-type C4-dicarboxylate transport system permease small subunit
VGNRSEMRRFTNLISRIAGVCAATGGVSLIVVMLLIVVSIVIRFFGRVLQGSYELVSLLIVVSIAFALGYTALRQGHIVVRIVVSRASERTQAIIGAFTTLISIAVWGAITWASVAIIHEKALTEASEQLQIPYLPFRCVWVLGLLLFCLVLLSDLFKAVSPKVSK